MGEEKEDGVRPFPKTLVDALIWGGWKNDVPGEREAWRRKCNTYDLDDRWVRIWPSIDYREKIFWEGDVTGKKYYDPDDPDLLDKIEKLKNGWTL